jgi:hypothetical protein
VLYIVGNRAPGAIALMRTRLVDGADWLVHVAYQDIALQAHLVLMPRH